MAVNPDPKPGRWILPLVILGMIAFTYFFVRELPEASTETTLVSGGETTTTTLGGDGSTSTTAAQTPLDPDTQAYLDTVDEVNTNLQLQGTEIVTVNEGFNTDPREIEYSDAESRFEAVANATTDLAEQLRGLTPPSGLEANQATLQTAIDLAVVSANEALAGLRSTDTGDRRNAAVAAFDQAASDFDTEVTNTHNAAGSAAAGA
ncbi:MAG TPA: hypothetical protein VFS66_01780 [Acidimicrobiia bacterium]|nr:hypothetical protein [Acidimicrobiia bacterium]